jgi:hypothetical protein
MSAQTTPEPEEIEYIAADAEDLSEILASDDDDDNILTR